MLEDTLDNITIPIALEHTGIAMGVVFGVLIVISGLIYLLKFVPDLIGGNEKKALAEAVNALRNAQTDRQPKVLGNPKNRQMVGRGTGSGSAASSQVSKTDDAQIVAVIMAAIAAQMSEEAGVPVSADGLVIRSIKKRR